MDELSDLKDQTIKLLNEEIEIYNEMINNLEVVVATQEKIINLYKKTYG